MDDVAPILIICNRHERPLMMKLFPNDLVRIEGEALLGYRVSAILVTLGVNRDSAYFRRDVFMCQRPGVNLYILSEATFG